MQGVEDEIREFLSELKSSRMRSERLGVFRFAEPGWCAECVHAGAS